MGAVLAVVLLVAAGCTGSDRADVEPQQSPSSGPSPTAALQEMRIDTGERDVRVRVEVADDPQRRSRGLMGRTELGADEGMLFVFPDERILSFWMRDTLIPLSIAYLDSRGRIVDIQRMEPLDDVPPHYASAAPARYALEVNEGYFDRNGVEVGDVAVLPAPLTTAPTTSD